MYVAMIWRPTPDRMSSFHRAMEFWSLLGDVEFFDSGHTLFNRAASRNKAVRRAVELGVDKLVVTDADCIPEMIALTGAYEAADDSAVRLPYTACNVRSQYGEDLGTFTFTCGGVYVTTPTDWFSAGGQDEAFDRWAPEDFAFMLAHETLRGPMGRHNGILLSLGHGDPEKHADSETDPNVALYREYEAANGNPDRMRELCSLLS
jgi:hypothetical protein